MATGLTEKQKSFVDEYLIDLCATKAAIRAGYSKKTAKAQGCELLKNPKIKAAVARHRKARAERTGIDSDYVLHELATLADTNMLDYIKVDKNGTASVDLSKLTRDQAKAIQEVTVDDIGGVITRVKFKLVDKLRTLDLLGKHTKVGAFIDKTVHDHTGTIEVVSNIDAPPGSSTDEG